MRIPSLARKGLSLIELIVVLVILVVLAALILPLVSGHTDQAREDVTRQNLRQLQEALLNHYWPDMDGMLPGVAGGYPHPGPASPRQQHPQLRYLFFNPVNESPTPAFDPVSRRGWRGPYLQHDGSRYKISGSFTNFFGENGDPTFLDGWGNPLVLQQPTSGTPEERVQYTRLLSAGPNGTIDTPAGEWLPARSTCGDDLLLYLRVADTRP